MENVHDQWSELIKKWQASGQSQRAFCREENLSYWQFRDYLKKSGWQPAKKRKKKPTRLIQVNTKHLPNAVSQDFIAITYGAEGFRVKLNLDLRF